MKSVTENDETIKATTNWLEHFIIQHNFCPFAAKPFKAKQIRYVSYPVTNENELADKLIDEMLLLKDADPQEIETSIVITPLMLADFMDYNQFLDVVDSIIAELELEGIIQVASFHPDYQFTDLDKDDVRNYTNRSPYPMFHLIREDSITKARQTMDVEAIPDRNMDVLMGLGIENIDREWD